MRIALFSDTFDEVNGVANTLQYLAAFAQEKDIHIDFFIHADMRADKEKKSIKETQKILKKKSKDKKTKKVKNKKGYTLEKRGSVRIFRFKAVLPIEYYNGLLFDLVTPRYAIIKRFEKTKYNLIHTATPGSMGLTAAYLAAHYRLPMIGVYHTAIPEYVKPMAQKQIEKWSSFFPPVGSAANWIGDSLEGFSREIIKWYYNQCTLVLAPSRYFQEELSGWFNSPVEIFTRGVDTEKFKPLVGADKKQNNLPVAIYVGRVSVEKNLQILLSIFKERKNVVLKVVGDGPFRQEMQEQLPNAEFTGFLKGKELVEAYSQADFFVFPSETDTFGNVILEAMSCGLPVLVSDKMAPKELIQEGKTGFVCEDENVFAEKIDLLTKDNRLRKKMSKLALQYARSRKWSEVFEDLIAKYKRVISSAKTKQKKQKKLVFKVNKKKS